VGHILQHVLNKIHAALRNSGEVLIIQPALQGSTIVLRVDNNKCLEKELPEPNFHANLQAIDIAVVDSINGKLFSLVDEAIYPDDDMVLVHEYDSITEYEENHRELCMDIEHFDLLVSEMKSLAKSQVHVVEEHMQEHRLLLRKLS